MKSNISVLEEVFTFPDFLCFFVFKPKKASIVLNLISGKKLLDAKTKLWDSDGTYYWNPTNSGFIMVPLSHLELTIDGVGLTTENVVRKVMNYLHENHPK